MDDLYFIPFGILTVIASILGIALIESKVLKQYFARSVFDYKTKQFILLIPMAIYFAV